MLFKLQVREQLDRVAAAAVGEMVDVLFLRKDLLMEGAVVALEQAEGFFDIRARGAEQRQQQLIAAVQGQSRRVEEAGIQGFDLGAVLLFPDRLAFILHDAAAELFIDAEHREQADGAAEVEDRVGVGDHAGIHAALPQAVQKSETVDHGDGEEHQDRFAEIEEDVDDADAPRLRFRADGADDGGRHAVAEVDADDHGVDGLESQQAGGGKGLQDANRG